MSNDQQTLEDLMKENLELTKELQRQMRSVRHYLLWQKIVSIFYLIIIIGPIIIGIIYLPPLLKNVVAPYQELLGGNKSGGLDINSILNGLNR
ncbi:MAG: hypothetical protein AAB956_00055 [Patescibacteria group bacterium]